jgi:hypothetical protein
VESASNGYIAFAELRSYGEIAHFAWRKAPISPRCNNDEERYQRFDWVAYLRNEDPAAFGDESLMNDGTKRKAIDESEAKGSSKRVRD